MADFHAILARLLAPWDAVRRWLHVLSPRPCCDEKCEDCWDDRG